MKTKLIMTLASLAWAGTMTAQVPPVISYQGRLQAGGTNHSGAGQFKLALVSPGTNVSRQATAVATVTSGFVTSIGVINGGAGYVDAPAVNITDATGNGATVVAQVSEGVVTNIAVQITGSGYSPAPTVNIAPPPPSYVYGTFWSNDGSSNRGGEPASPVPVPVQQGLFTVFLAIRICQTWGLCPLRCSPSPTCTCASGSGTARAVSSSSRLTSASVPPVTR
jgi:hypothetical protein